MNSTLAGKKIMIVFGTRPEAIKLSPVIQALKEDGNFKIVVCSTGQHREMLKQVLDIFNIEVDDDLDLMKPNQTLFDITADSLVRLKGSIEKHQPEIIMVQGDTTTAFTSALAAYYKNVKVAHVEAGLRSYDLFHPFPEEANRRFISVISDYNFVPTGDAKKNLIQEGFSAESIYVTGNTVVDALLQIKVKIDDPNYSEKIKSNFEFKLGQNLFSKKLILITLHRREKFGEELKDLLYTLKDLAEKYPDYNFIYPVHLNPNVVNPVREILGTRENFILTQPLDYLNFLYLMSKCHFIMSDSGGVQEECYVFNKPIIVMREVTERNEAIRAGYAFLTGSDKEIILSRFSEIDSKIDSGFNFFTTENPYGDGKASGRIVEIFRSKSVN
ncbi:MAG: UDP-N-acetylglucosamine 2-epimerase (non-hydrolyzing) [Ignavibacteriae bacterium HGW-Ignavibacteriae-3]|nr:MAG: UDP-N-acetylglucosamine 2-epimerase (non-hydrolyzing) [Ignavibacteriae bacterium HGW-Ignavibacteriae-3]